MWRRLRTLSVAVAREPVEFALRSRRPWRVAFVVYVLMLTVGTHWPRLQLGTEEVPVSDKLVHAAAFGMLALLLMQTGWVRRRWLAAVMAAIWAVVDELSQGIPWLGRTVRVDDVLAGLCGILTVLMVAWAMRIRGAGAARVHEQRWRHALNRMFQRPATWIMVILAGLIGAAVGVPVSLAISRLFINPMPAQAFVIGVVFGGSALGYFVIEVLRRRELEAMRAIKPCLRCNELLAEASAAQPAGSCPACSETYIDGQWADPPSLSAAFLSTRLIGAFVLWMLSVAAMMTGAVGILQAGMNWPWARRLDEFYRLLGADIGTLIDATIVAAAAALILSWYRRSVARRLDRQSRQCVHCDYDLRATAVDNGRGVCPECGEMFLVVPNAADADLEPSVGFTARVS